MDKPLAMELFRIELVDPDEALLCRLLKCEAVNRWVITSKAMIAELKKRQAIRAQIPSRL